MRKLEGKVALITGSGRGIGQAIALKLSSEGARVLVNDLDPAAVQETVDKIRQQGGEAEGCPGDVTATGFGERLVAHALEAWGDIDIIVNNAGYTWDSVIHKTTDEQWQAMLDIHVTAPFRILRAASEHIRAKAKIEQIEGRRKHRKVVNISSIVGMYGNAGQAGYSAGKAAVIGLTQTLAKEWGRYQVNVNCVAFGLIETRMTAALGAEEATAEIGERRIEMGMRPEAAQALAQATPLGRAGSPDEAAGAVYLLCLPESDYISGQTLLVSGGLIM